MNITEAIIQAKLGNSIAFTGAGFPSSTKSVKGEKILSADDLRKRLSQDLMITDHRDLQLVTELYEDEFGAGKLRSIIEDHYCVGTFLSGHAVIADIPWRRVYTTNYDDLFEVASSRSYYSASISDAPDSLPRGRPAVIHLHGSAARSLAESEKMESFQLSMSSYLRSEFPTSPWVPVFRNDLRFALSVFFIGYSLSDLDISRVVFDETIRQKTFIIVHPDTDPIELRRLSKFGNAVAMDIETFSRLIEETEVVGGDHNDEMPLIAFTKFSAPELPVEASQDLYIDLLTRGTFEQAAHADQQAKNNSTYATPRTQLKLLRNNDRRRFLVHSNLGNGKTVFLDQASSIMVEKGYKVYSYTRAADTGPAEVDRIFSSADKICLIFDNLNRSRDLIAYASARVGNEDAIIVSCRSITYEIEKQDISNTLQNDFVEIDLNEIDKSEAIHFDSVFHSYGIWGDDIRIRPEKRVDILRNECAGEIRSIVLRSFHNGVIAEKLSEWSNDIQHLSANDQQLTLAIILSTLVHADITIIDISDILNIKFTSIKETLSSTVAGEIIGVDGIYADVRSAVLAEFLIREGFPPELVLSTLTILVRRLSEWAHSGDQYKDFMREIMRFAVVGRIFEGAGKSDFIVSFYESVRSLDYCRSNPAFWLQYAMARMAREEYGLAGTMLATAEGQARQRQHYNLFQIHNQKARYLLLSRARTESFSDYDAAYMNAFQIISSQIRDGKGKRDPYPLRLILPHAEFIVSRGANLSSGSRRLAKQLLASFEAALLEYAHGSWRDERGWRPALLETAEVLASLPDN